MMPKSFHAWCPFTQTLGVFHRCPEPAHLADRGKSARSANLSFMPFNATDCLANESEVESHGLLRLPEVAISVARLSFGRVFTAARFGGGLLPATS